MTEQAARPGLGAYRRFALVFSGGKDTACRSAIDASHTTDGWKSLDTVHPTYVALVAEGADVNTLRLVPDDGDASVLPFRGLFVQVAACAGYAATRSEDLVNQHRIMIDAIRADGAPRITRAAMVRLCATGQANSTTSQAAG